MLSAPEVSKVHKRFKQLSFNRTDHVLLMRSERQQERLANQGYDSNKVTKPQMNANSQKIYDSMVAKQKIQKGGMSH